MIYSQRLERILRVLIQPSSQTLKLSLFPALLPFVYQTLLQSVREFLLTAPKYLKYSSEISALLASPATLLLPRGLRVYLALYAVTSAMTTFFKSASPRDLEKKVDGESQWRDWLPPVS